MTALGRMTDDELLRRLDDIDAAAELVDNAETDDERDVRREALRKKIAALRDDVWKDVVA